MGNINNKHLIKTLPDDILKEALEYAFGDKAKDDSMPEFSLEVKGIFYTLLRLTNMDYYRLQERSLCLHEQMLDWWSLYSGFIDDVDKLPKIKRGELVAILEWLFGESSDAYDSWKSSFSYPFLMYFKKDNQTFFYCLKIMDYKSLIETRFRKLLKAGEENDNYIHDYFPELTEEDIKNFNLHFYAKLANLVKALRPYLKNRFYHTVRPGLIIYGHTEQQGFFDWQFKTPEAFEKVEQEIIDQLNYKQKI